MPLDMFAPTIPAPADFGIAAVDLHGEVAAGLPGKERA